ncbi:ROK family transcriptional regulator [Cnuibacter physcomitrellae]|uniref:ROK family transcriptional regulator n=1 Tax=Cnuibacter physcomitrellae TaxID=1619308 RepID=UPI00157D7413|nr:ROK family transcriptional regulator [Cnuibacter physcomitrellae]
MRTHIGEVLALFREHRELSRTDVIDLSGLSRSTVNQRLAALEASGLIEQIGGGESTGGRPSSRFVFNADRARLLTADVGATGLVAAVCDLSGTPVRWVSRRVDVWEGPDAVLSVVDDAFDELLQGEDVWGVGIGVPGPVDFAAGEVVNPPIMTGWDRFDIRGWFARFGVPVMVENDANARAVAEAHQRHVDDLISLKVGTGIGSGLVFNGQIIRGGEGAAGDIGHTAAVASGDGEPLACRCGNAGCVEAYAGGWAILRDLAAAGVEAEHVSDVVALVRRGEGTAVRLVRQAGRVLGDAVADLVSILNPRTIVLSGQLAECEEVLLSGVRERVYQRSQPLATRHLSITVSELGEVAGVAGLALTTSERLLGTDDIDTLIDRLGVSDGLATG